MILLHRSNGRWDGSVGLVLQPVPAHSSRGRSSGQAGPVTARSTGAEQCMANATLRCGTVGT